MLEKLSLELLKEGGKHLVILELINQSLVSYIIII